MALAIAPAFVAPAFVAPAFFAPGSSGMLSGWGSVLVAQESAGGLLAKGKAYAKRATEHYRAAQSNWEEAALRLRPLSDESAQRILSGRAALAAVMLDADSYTKILGVRARVPVPVLSLPTSGSLSDRDLDRSTRVISKARRAQSDPERALFLFEAQSLLLRARGDLEQARADALFKQALGRLGKDSTEEAFKVAIELRYRLRDFSGVIATAYPGGKLRVPNEPCDYLEQLRAAAVFTRPELVKSVDAERQARCDKRVEAPRTSNALGRTLLGSKADLALMTKVFSVIASQYHVNARERALSAYIAGVAALELGDAAYAAEILDPVFRDKTKSDRTETIGARLECLCLAQLSFIKDLLGDYESALELSAAAISKARAIKSESLVAALLINRGRVELGLGKRDAAIQTVRELLAMKSLALDQRVRSRLLAGSAWFAASLENPALIINAKRAYQAAAKDASSAAAAKSIDAETRLQIDVHLANVLRAEANHSSDASESKSLRDKAIDLQNRAMRAAYAGELFELAAVASANLGELYLESGDLTKAKGFVDWALARAEESNQFETRWRCHWYRSRIAAVEKNETKAESELSAAIALIESYRDRILDAGAKAGFMTDKMDVYRYAVARAVTAGRPELAFEWAERGRARALVESLGWRFVSLASRQHSDLYRRYIRLVSKTKKARHTRKQQFFGVASKPADYDALRTELSSLRKRFTASDRLGQTVRALVDGAPATGAEVRGLIGAGVTLIEYFDLGTSLLAFVVDAKSVRVVRLPVAHADLQSSVKKFVDGRAGDQQAARKLYDQLVEPVESLIKTARVVIVPYGSLHALPFDALKAKDGKFFIEKWEASYLPSASIVKFLDWNGRFDRGAGKASLVAFADPSTDYDADGAPDKAGLAGARQEVAALSASFANRQVFYGKDAREAALRELSRSSGVVHIACHGEFYPSRPWSSTLFLAKDSNEPAGDGYLRAYEIYGLDLRGTRLVALSGCETGVSQVTGGDDPSGLATAFLHSGASSLLVSLWQVEDRATAELMKSFYRLWIGEKKKRTTALREAKLGLLRRGFDQPRQWASFVLVARD